jgi:hypothetical protein
MEIGSFGVLYKTFVMKRFSRNEVISAVPKLRKQGSGLSGMVVKDVVSIRYLQLKMYF